MTRELKIEELGHNLTEKLAIALQQHILLREIPDSDVTEILESAHYLFRDYLARTIRNVENLEFPRGITIDKLKEIYEMSDFNWADYSKFSNFREWYLENTSLV